MTLNPKTLFRILYIVAGIGVVWFGISLRIQNSEARILHSDEAVQAYQLWELMETGHYQYDPEDKHGPTLYYLSKILNNAVGISGDDLSDRTNLRLLPILASALLLLLILVGNGKFDLTFLIAAALFAISPFPVIYGAYYVQEALFVLISFVLLYAGAWYWRFPEVPQAILCGLLTAALFATKETAIIHIAAIGLAILAMNESGFRLSEIKKRLPRTPVAACFGSFVLGWIFFYSSGFTNFSQLTDSVLAFVNYAERSQGAGHDKPLFYYLSIFWPRTAEGIQWGEAPILVFAFLGLVLLAMTSGKRSDRARLVVYYGAIAFALYSIIPYKTPWLMLASYVSLTVAAGYVLKTLIVDQSNSWIRIVAIGVVLFTLGDQYQSTQLAERYAADTRNPYLYQHTTGQFAKLVERIEDLEALDPDTQLSIAVGGEDNAWPLPWHLRNNETVGYWADTNSIPALDLVIGPAGSLPLSLKETHTPEYHGLRENVLLECWIRKELWEAFMQTR